jgi:uncharacterized protein YbaR (Trm112 family)
MQDDSEIKKVDDLGPWAEDLVCPVCYSQLRFLATEVVCVACARTYPIVDRIPVLIPQRATRPAK